MHIPGHSECPIWKENDGRHPSLHFKQKFNMSRARPKGAAESGNGFLTLQTSISIWPRKWADMDRNTFLHRAHTCPRNHYKFKAFEVGIRVVACISGSEIMKRQGGCVACLSLATAYLENGASPTRFLYLIILFIVTSLIL